MCDQLVDKSPFFDPVRLLNSKNNPVADNTVMMISGSKTFCPKTEGPSMRRLITLTRVTVNATINTRSNPPNICFCEKMDKNEVNAMARGIAPILTLATDNAVVDDKTMLDSAAEATGLKRFFIAIIANRIETKNRTILLNQIPTFENLFI